MSFLILATGILVLILLTTWVKLNAFLSFAGVHGIGLANGMNIGSVTVQCRPYGRSAGFLVVILVVGAMIGKLIADYGSTTDYICIHELVRKEVLV